jgi:2-polyprenyl-6-methoxyphenol hydroxylase-like FAD-dependent oxidoreductase
MSNETKTITIIGGGLAGLTLGIGLRQRGVPVVVWEAGTYPRHRVCGEFISGSGIETLRKFGLLESLEQTGARAARTVIFCTGHRPSLIRDLPKPALCVSRFELDGWLATRFRELGGQLHCGTRWTGSGQGEGVVRATGRRVQTERNGWRWYGLKAHARKLELTADLEMHFASDGYIGLCRLPGGVVNVCGLFRRRRNEPALPANTAERFCAESSGALCGRLQQAAWDESSFCAVAGLSYHGTQADGPSECAVGDALAMIPPVTGNGMSMAFESAEQSLEPLADYAQGRAEWTAACGRVRQRCRNAFARRLWCARGLQRGLFLAPIRIGLLPVIARSALVWRLFFGATR